MDCGSMQSGFRLMRESCAWGVGVGGAKGVKNDLVTDYLSCYGLLLASSLSHNHALSQPAILKVNSKCLIISLP